jgi:hypothetical protein
MSLEKAIHHKKERRKPYRGAKAAASGCRNHGGCPRCEGNRTHHNKKREPIEERLAKDEVET